MAIAVFKNKTFKVSSKGVYTFNSLTWGGEIQAEAQDKLNSKPSTYIKGNGLKNMSFEIPLKTSLSMNVRKEIEDWEAIRDSLQSSIFMLGIKPLGANKWLLKSVNVSDTGIDNKGNLIEATLKLDFEEFVRPGSADGAATTGSAKSKKAVSKKVASKSKTKKTSVKVGISPSNYIYKPQTKVEQTRKNANANAAVARGVTK